MLQVNTNVTILVFDYICFNVFNEGFLFHK